MEVVQDIVTNPSFPEKEIRKLKSEITSEIAETRGNDGAIARVFWNKFLFEGHPYGKPILGTTHDIEKLKRADVVRHYQNLFQDRNLLVVGSGDTEASFVHAWAKRIAENRPNSPGANPIQVSPPPKPWTKRRVLFVDKADRTQTQVYFGQVGIRMTDPNFFPLYLANHVFGGGSFSARLMKEVRVKRGWSYGAYSYFRQGRQPRSFQAYTFPATKDTPNAIALMDKMLHDWKAHGITKDEYNFAKASLINSSGFSYNTPAKRVENILLERTLDLPDGFMRSYADHLAKVTLSEANSAVKSFVRPDQMSVLVLGTAKNLKTKVADALKIPPDEISVVRYTKE
jgi:zinc protease